MAADEPRPSEINTASFSFRVPRKLKEEAYDIAKTEGRGWYVDTLTQVLTVLIARKREELKNRGSTS